MKIVNLLPIFILTLSCGVRESASNKETKKKYLMPELQNIINTANVEGAILIYDMANDNYYSNDFEWSSKGNLPASTFKIANSIIALETGIVENDNTLLKWNGEKRSMKNWEQDLTLKEAFHFSCVPCYQDIARKIGVNKMSEYLHSLGFGNMIVDSASIDLFWLEGRSRISQFQQIDFLKRFYHAELPISPRTTSIMKRMMVIEKNDTYELRGKTGWSIRNGIDNGWFVGYIHIHDKTYFFATNITPKGSIESFFIARKELTFKALELLGFYKASD